MPTQQQRDWLKKLGASQAVLENATNPDGVLENAINPDAVPEDGKPPPFAIVASVGRGGKNQKDDVIAVQAELNRKLKLKLELDGKCGSQTVGAIIAYQKSIGFKRPDGLIEVGGKTFSALAGESGGAAGATDVDAVSGAGPAAGKKGATTGAGVPSVGSGAGAADQPASGAMTDVSMVKVTKGGSIPNTQETKTKADGGYSDMEAARTAAQGSGNTLNNKLQVTPNAAAQKCFNEGWKSWDAGETLRTNAKGMASMVDGVSLAARVTLIAGATQSYQKAKAKFSEGLRYL